MAFPDNLSAIYLSSFPLPQCSHFFALQVNLHFFPHFLLHSDCSFNLKSSQKINDSIFLKPAVCKTKLQK